MTDEDAPPPEDAPSRYDAMADGYALYWAPVIRPGALRVLDLVATRTSDKRART